MSDEELKCMKQMLRELCDAVLDLQIDINGKPDLRDQFAMAALTGLLAYSGRWSSSEDIAQRSFGIADAMMEARK